jgi:TRAP-type transport system periplasmic protein
MSNAIGDMGFVRPDPMVLAFAFADFTLNEEIARQEWRENGLIFISNHASPPYYYMCRVEVASLSDLAGLRVRTPGGGSSRLATALGLIPVNLPSSEVFTALERGSVDCVAADPTYLLSGPQIMELTRSVMMLPTAPLYNSGAISLNPEFWRSLSDEQRHLLLDAAARALVNLQIAWQKETDEALEAAKEQSVLLAEPDQALRQAYDQWVAEGVGGMAEIASGQYGIQDPEALFALFQTYIDKWDGLLAGVDRSNEEALFKLVKENAFDKVDVTTYGMD